MIKHLKALLCFFSQPVRKATPTGTASHQRVTGWGAARTSMLALLLLIPASAFGQEAPLPGEAKSGESMTEEYKPPSDGKARWSVTLGPESVRPGERLAVQFTATIDDGWHMYALDSPAGKPLRVTFDTLPDGFALQDPLRQTDPTRKYDPNFQSEALFFNEHAEVRAGVHVADSLNSGTYEIGGAIRYMVCNDEMCMPPRTKEFSSETTVEPGGPREEHLNVDYGSLVAPASDANRSAANPAQGGSDPMSASSVAPSSSATAPLGERGLFAFLLLAAGAGVGALFMPCVFPMVPLTVSYFTGHVDKRGAMVRQAGVYGLTIVGAFTGLGALAAALLGASGAQSIAANPWINLLIGGGLAAFALSLLGLFEFRLPSSVVNYFNRQSNEKSGYAGAVFMGLTLTVVSFSCTAPFVGGLLAAAAQGTWAYPVLGMLVFSGVLALPFVGFALFPSGLERLPDSGDWMNALKVTFGFVELAAALKFFSNADLVWGTGILSRPLVIALTAVLFALAGLYLLGKLRLPVDAPAQERAASGGAGPQTIGVGRLLAATAFLGLALYMTPGLWGASLGQLDAYLPPRQDSDPGRLATGRGASKTAVEELSWNEDDIEGALTEAEETGKPIFVDFTGYTCTNCREMETTVFPEPAVAEHLREDFVRLRLYTDDSQKGPSFQRYQQQMTRTVALPTYAILTPKETLLAQHSGMASPEAFDTFLEKGLKQYDASANRSPGGSTASADSSSPITASAIEAFTSNRSAGASSP